MPTESQLNANRQNAQFSTGPRTETGKSTSARNALTLGLYTRQDYVQPDEREIYREFCETMLFELSPETLLEETLVSEITGASWRLRRCSAVEAELADYAIQDPMLDETKQKSIRSLERARSTASSLLHRGINQLRRLQSDRRKLAGHPAITLPAPVPELASNCSTMPCPPVPDLDLLTKPDAEFLQDLDAILAQYAELGSNCAPPAAQAPELASNCSPQGHAPLAASVDAPVGPPISRSAPCPDSARPYPGKNCEHQTAPGRCCGKNAPPVLGKAA
jgi:hypothetical protein